jgi:O-antigen/teichoic acid export membrane protein
MRAKSKAVQVDPKSKNCETEECLWDEIGFHRPLGGLLYNLTLIVLTILFGVVINLYILPKYVYPFPETLGWQDMTSQLFYLTFVIADLGIGAALQRFIGEIAVREPRKSLQYVRFFIWFQMFTGLIQITGIAAWVLCGGVTQSDLAYASWFFLLYSTIQYPGFLGVFRATLESYQQFHKSSAVRFLQGVVLESTTRIAFVFAGKFIGRALPGLGELMGITLGSILGAYADDFIAAAIAAKWTLPVLQKTVDPNIKLIDVFMPRFDKDVVKKSLWFGLRSMLPGLIAPAANLVVVLIYTQYLPNYSTIIGLFYVAQLISGALSTFSFPTTASLAEAYHNGKYALTRNYINRQYRWSSMVNGFLGAFIIAIAPLLANIAGSYYSNAIIMIQIMVGFRFIEVLASVNDTVLIASGKPEYTILGILAEQTIRIGSLFIMLNWVPQLAGLAFVFSIGLGWTVKWVVSFLLVKKRIPSLKINHWQSVTFPLIAASVEIFLLVMAQYNLLPLLSMYMHPTLASILMILAGLIVGPFLIFFPLHALLGGWDFETIDTLRKAKEISGPSKVFVMFIYWIAKGFGLPGKEDSRRAQYLNRVGLDHTNVKKEIDELMKMKLQAQTANKLIEVAKV